MQKHAHRLPGATYRLQFNNHFTFAEAEALLDYWRGLGITDLYASPIFPAGPESTHGYDVCAFDRLNPNLGSKEDFDRLAAGVRERGMGLLLDMVPNHMGTEPNNRWWRDVLEKGPESPFAHYFDISWDAQPDRKIVLPVLGERYGEVLRQRQLKVKYHKGQPCLAYFDKNFPLSPRSRKDLPDPAGLPAINESPERLHAIIQQQHYRLAFWRVGAREINYRRFFDVTGLAGLRVEAPGVFQAVHRLVFDLLNSGKVTGLRIDHPDGLRDPKTYLDRLQEHCGKLFVVAEKILSDEEQLPEDWSVSGTTGYDYLNVLNGLFVASQNEESFTGIYREFTGVGDTYLQAAFRAKRFVLEQLFPSEVDALVRKLRAIAQRSIDGADFTEEELRAALVEFIVAFPVYRVYPRDGLETLPAPELEYVEQAARAATGPAALLDYICQVLSDPAENLDFVQRLQQLTGPATAKGLEDTAFYRYFRFISLNEVGGNPGKFGNSTADFHAYQQRQRARWPHSLLATATHDTKRGEDLRARLNVLSEMPEKWRLTVAEWRGLAGRFKSGDVPCGNHEYFLYQILAGSWNDSDAGNLDAYIERVQQYLEKAMREGKAETSWTSPNAEYERGAKGFVRSILTDERFRESLARFAKELGFFGVFNSLAQLVLKIFSPGIPDFYQGTELWEFSFVDPDNRRPVDYGVRREMLHRLEKAADPAALLENPGDGAVKLFVMSRALGFRRKNQDLLEEGGYSPIAVRGEKREHVVAFARGNIVVVAPRLPFLLAGGERKGPVGAIWGDTQLDLPADSGGGSELFTGRTLESARLSDLLSSFPVAVLRYGSTTR